MDIEKILFRLTLAFLSILVILNFATVFTPELGFDALWYHLTLPKLWILKHQWYFPGGLLYYSAMPRLSEILFTPLIWLLDFRGPKLLQFTCGLGTAYLIYKIAKRVGLKPLYQLMSVCLFYITWLVSWQSGSGYIDLIRTFIEVLALYLFVLGRHKMGSVLLGLAIGTKWLSIGSLMIYALVFGISIIPISLFVAAPWFLIAYIYTKNPIYPIFSPIISHTNPDLLKSIYRVFTMPYQFTFPYDDFITPVAGILIMLTAVSLILSKDQTIKKLSTIGLLGGCFSLALNPPSSRFLLPYLPAIAIASVYLVSKFPLYLKQLFLCLFVISFAVVVSMRLIADKKYLPFLLGKQSVNNFLYSQSYRLPDTFIDSDDYVKTNLPSDALYLIDKYHNLYYFPYNFDHTSWYNSAVKYDYLVTKDQNPKEIKNGIMLHVNDLGVQIFKLND